MTTIRLAIATAAATVCALTLLLTWALCRAAALADRALADIDPPDPRRNP